MQIKTAWKTA